MGIKGFFTDLKKGFNYKSSSVSLETMRNSRLAVDTSTIMYAARYGLSSYNKYPVIRYFVRFITKMFSYNIYPIFVFDGVPPSLKQATNEGRTIAKNKYLKEIEDIQKKLNNMKEVPEDMMAYETSILMSGDVKALEEMEEMKKLAADRIAYKTRIHKLEKRISITPTKDDVASLKGLFDELYIPHFTCNGYDAEKLCSYLNKKGYVDYIMSSDSDILDITGYIHIELNEGLSDTLMIKELLANNNFEFIKRTRKANQLWRKNG